MALHDSDDVAMTLSNMAHQDRERLLRDEADEPPSNAERLASIEDEHDLYRNLFTKYALVTQGGAIGLTLIIWGACFIAGLIFFSAHVLLNSAGVLLMVQAILILQPTRTPVQKRKGTAYHFIFNSGALSALLGGLVIIEINKFSHDGAHFKSPHAILGLFTYLLLLAQGVVGFTQYYTPMLYGSVDKAKSVWKYHRMSGYATLAMGLATVAAATSTGYNQNVLKVPLWLVLVTLVAIVGGIVPQISVRKFGLNVK